MIQYSSTSISEQESYCLLGIIVNRGKGRKISHFAGKLGFTKVNCLFAAGRSSAGNRLLKLLALEEGDKEFVLLGVKKQFESEILKRFDDKFHFDKPHKGIAFTIPIVGPGESELCYKSETPYMAVITILNENLTNDFRDFVRENGYPGLTSVKARGAASITHPLMEMKVESAKSLILMIVHRSRVDNLINIVTERYHLESENTGIILVHPLSNITGLAPVKDGESPTGAPAEYSAVKQLIIALVPNGCAEEYLHKMKTAGVSGSTILHSRLSNLSPDAASLLPFSSETEEEMVITLASHSFVQKIRHNLDKLNFDNQIEKSYAISLPVVLTKGVRAEQS